MGVSFLSALFLVVAVLLQKTKEDGLSSTIVGGSTETYYGKDKLGSKDKLLYKLTIIVGIVFAVSVLAIYFLTPNAPAVKFLSEWKS